MQIKAYLDKNVMDKIFDLTSKKAGIRGLELLNFLAKCDECITHGGYWQKPNKISGDLIRILGENGNALSIIKDENFSQIIRDSKSFSLIITNDANKTIAASCSTSTKTLDEVIGLIEQVKNNSFFIAPTSVIEDFDKVKILHDPKSIIINDRYFFKNEYPEETLKQIIKVIVNKDFIGEISITIFYTNPKNEIPDVEMKMIKCRDVLQDCFPTVNFNLEDPIKTRNNSSNHTRFIFTDLSCLKSHDSFSYLASLDRATTIDRYIIIDPNNFRSNVKYLESMLDFAGYKIRQSNNGIIRSYLEDKSAKTN